VKLTESLAILGGRVAGSSPSIAWHSVWHGEPAAASGAAVEDALAAVWRLNTAGCRLVHWSAADGRQLCSKVQPLKDTLILLFSTVEAATALSKVQRRAEPSGSGTGIVSSSGSAAKLGATDR